VQESEAFESDLSLSSPSIFSPSFLFDMKRVLFLLVCGLMAAMQLPAQSVGINTTGNNPDASAMLDVQSTTQGMLVPRMNSGQRTTISSPAIGLLVYDLDTQSFWFHAASGWTELVAGNLDRLADADGNTQIQVEEGPDDNTIRFDVDGSEAMLLNPDGSLMVRGDDPFIPGFLKLYNGDSTHFLRFYGGRLTDADPFFNWQAGTSLRFATSEENYTGFAEHMRLTGQGWLGLGTNSPQAQLHVAEGEVLLQGTFDGGYAGPLPATGVGTRLMWVPQLAAFRVGRVSGTQWDLANIAMNSSVAGGLDNIASGPSSFVGGGAYNVASGSVSTVGGGNSNEAIGDYASVGGGSSNEAIGDYALVGGGRNNIAHENYSFIGGGEFNDATGIESFIGSGNDNLASGFRSFVGGGAENASSGDYSSILGGYYNSAHSYGETAIGFYTETYTPNSTTSFNADDRLFVVGNGTGTSTSARSNALTILKDGRTGIGTSSPKARLHVENGQIMMRGYFVSNYSGAIPDSGSGTRLMWIPEKSAFRVGTVQGAEWWPSSIGDYSSVVGGFANSAFGERTFVGGGSVNRANN
jgi:hypothetical protein